MRILFYVVCVALFVISLIGGTNATDAVSANATRVLIASALFAIAGVLA